MHRWRKELSPGADGSPCIYDMRLLPGGFIPLEEQEPCIDGLDFYLDAFRDLSTCRPSGLDLQPIPFTAIVEYSRIYEIDDFDEFAYLIRLMDNLYLKQVREAGDNKAGDNGGGTRNTNAKNHDQR